jgi:hypothetical protein
MTGAKVLNKTIPDSLNSMVYNTAARILVPGVWSDSSAPLKLIRLGDLRPLLPWMQWCSYGMLDFSFDEGFLAVCHNLSLKVIQRPIFWADARQKGGAERTGEGTRAHLHS